MPTLSFTFQVGNFPEGFQGNIQEFANQFAALLQGVFNGEVLQGQNGGVMPTSNVGVWIPSDGSGIYLWDPAASSYQPFTSVPVGSVFAFAGGAAPTNYLVCDGSSVAQATYPALFGLIGNTFGSLGPSVFNLPDLRGRFPIGIGTGVAYPDGTNPVGATSNGGMNPKLLAYFYGGETIQNVPAPANIPKTSIRIPPSFIAPATTNNQTQGLPPAVGMNYIIRSS